MSVDRQADLEHRHDALIERDRVIGLEAEAESARAATARVRSQLAVAQQRLDRKNARIRELADRLARLERKPVVQKPGLRARVGAVVRSARVAGRSHAVDEV